MRFGAIDSRQGRGRGHCLGIVVFVLRKLGIACSWGDMEGEEGVPEMHRVIAPFDGSAGPHLLGSFSFDPQSAWGRWRRGDLGMD